jgi:hypothetical protein
MKIDGSEGLRVFERHYAVVAASLALSCSERDSISSFKLKARNVNEWFDSHMSRG